MPHIVAALSAVSSRERHVKMAFDPEDFTWWVSSETLYAEFAGDGMPDKVWSAQQSVMLSNCDGLN
jgi:hypothetical protein